VVEAGLNALSKWHRDLHGGVLTTLAAEGVDRSGKAMRGKTPNALI